MASELSPFLKGLMDQFQNSEPAAGYYSYFAPMIGSNNPYARFLRDSQGRYFNQYLGALSGSPELTWTQYLQGLHPQQEFQSLAPAQRGETAAQFAPRVRYLCPPPAAGRRPAASPSIIEGVGARD